MLAPPSGGLAPLRGILDPPLVMNFKKDLKWEICFGNQWRIQGGMLGMRTPSRSNFFHFHVVFGKILAK